MRHKIAVGLKWAAYIWCWSVMSVILGSAIYTVATDDTGWVHGLLAVRSWLNPFNSLHVLTVLLLISPAIIALAIATRIDCTIL